jgi:hypothetical protein
VRRWAGRAAGAAALWLLVLGYAYLDDRTPHVVGLAAAVTAILAVVWLSVDAFEDTRPTYWRIHATRIPTRTFDPRFSRLSQMLAEASDRRAAAEAVHSSIAAVTDALLRDKFRIDRHDDPAAARALLGDEVWVYLNDGHGNDKNVFSERLLGVLARLESL